MADPFYSFYDIPTVMRASLKGIIAKNQRCTVRLVNAEQIRAECEDLVKDTKITLMFTDDHSDLNNQ